MTTKLSIEHLEEMTLRAKIAEVACKLTWLKPCEAACYMNIGESTLWKLVNDGSIPSSKDGSKVRIKKTDIDDYWTKRKRMGYSKGFSEDSKIEC